MANDSDVGVHVTLREIYDATQAAVKSADGGRSDIAALRRDVQLLDSRVQTIEKQQSAAVPLYLKRAGTAVGLLAAGIASGWAAFKGG